MFEALLNLLPCSPDAARPVFLPLQHVQVEHYIMSSTPRVDPAMIDSIMGVRGCLARFEGPQRTILVVRWEGQDQSGSPRAIQGKWENGYFLTWHGENFRR